MYKVVSGALTILFIIALTFSFLGLLAFSPLAMIVSLLVIGFSVFLTTLLFGLLFNVKVHTESSYITGVILFFMFSPTLELAGLAILVLIGMIAGASKFLLVYKGRHIFNAAAIAAVIIGFTGLTHATWWVGTPILVVPTFLLGFAILQKTRRVASSGTFLGLASILVIAMLLIEGATLSESLVLWLSWPILFFSSFMLTEPLTLPKKKWQTIIVAVVAAVLFAIPIHIGDFTTSPALALVIGNLVAFGFSRRRAIKLKFVEQKQLTPTTTEFVFTPSHTLHHEAGQYIEIMVPAKKDDLRGNRRSFSITSAPGEETLRLGIKFYEPSSVLKQILRQLQKGAIIPTTGINGDFTLPKDAATPLFYVAGGIGITPFISHVQHLMRTKQARDTVLFYSISNISELAYKDILVQSGIKVFVITKSDETIQLPTGWTHINEPFITQTTLSDNVADLASRTAFISGPPLMIDGTKKHLKKLGVERIKTDYFIGY